MYSFVYIYYQLSEYGIRDYKVDAVNAVTINAVKPRENYSVACSMNFGWVGGYFQTPDSGEYLFIVVSDILPSKQSFQLPCQPTCHCDQYLGVCVSPIHHLIKFIFLKITTV